jgi:hypothetical protein
MSEMLPDLGVERGRQRNKTSQKSLLEREGAVIGKR